MRHKHINVSTEDKWEEQREARSVDIREIHNLDGCGECFIGVYLCQKKSYGII